MSEILTQAPLPMAHLQLGNRAYKGCYDTGCRTIADVIAGLESGRLSTASLGKKTAEEVAAALRTLQEVTDGDVVDGERFWIARGISEDRIALTSTNLERLAPEVRECRLGMLHLKKACSGLEAVEITTVGGLLDAARAGIGKLKNFGAAAHAEVVAALPALSKSVQPDGIVDWCRHATERGFPLIPEAEADKVTGEAVLRLLLEICKAIIPAQIDDRGWQIFQKRLLAPEEQRETLEDIGAVYGVTRERIRQVEAMCIDAIRKPLFDEDYFGLNFRLRPELRQIFTDARKHYESLGLPAWPESRWVGELATLWQVPTAAIVRYDRLLTELFGYRPIRLERAVLESLIFDEGTSDKEAKRMAGLVEALHDILAADNLGLDAFGLAIALKKQRPDFKGLDEVPVLIELCSSAERFGEDRYRLRFDHLRGRAEQAFRVLSDHGSPLHFSEILREINRLLPETKRLESKENMVNQFASNSRLQPIGKTGQWTLTEWGLVTRSLVDVIEDVLTEADEAMPRDEIATKVLEKRPGSTASVAMLLEGHPERFRKVGPRIYALAAWGASSDDEKWWDNDAVARFVEEFFSSRKGQIVEFKELREAFSENSGLASRSARGILAFHPAVEVDRPNTYRRTVRLRENWQTFQRERRSGSERPLQADRIVEVARAKLLAAPTGDLQVIEIVQHVEAELGVQRPNIYAAISQSDEIETVAVEGSVFKICRLPGRVEVAFPQLRNMANAEWRAECDRATARLTVEDVDIGLFLLGRQFDQAMRHLLETARDHAGMVVTKDQIKSVGTRIVWAVGHKVFHDEATLNLLKNERNARGHEPAPIEERRAIMKFAPFLAGLYLDYLLIIEQKIEIFRKASAAPALA